jgi:hypothetical protein
VVYYFFMDTLIPSAADLAGDPDVIARAEALRPVVEAASNDIEKDRRLPPALLDRGLSRPQGGEAHLR